MRTVARTTRTVTLLAALAVTIGGAVTPAPALAQAVRVTLAEAMQLIDAAQKEAMARNYRLSFAVVDARGDVVALGRMPGANPATADTAIGKAMATAMFGQPSAALVPRATTPVMQGLNEMSGGRLRFLPGALPIVRNGLVIGAMAASGATGQQDEDTVRAALPR